MGQFSTHYSHALEADKLAHAAHVIATRIVGLEKRHELRVIACYRGMSGTATATAVMLEYHRITGRQLHMAYVRKADEKSHGWNVESTRMVGQGEKVSLIPVIIDDLISTGNTVASIITKLLETGFRGHMTDHAAGQCMRWDLAKVFLTNEGSQYADLYVRDLSSIQTKYPIIHQALKGVLS